jgi:hypothetical protein
MKKLLVTLTATLICVGAFAQGKVQFANDSLHLIYYSTDAGGLRPGDSALAGKGVFGGAMPGGVTLVADLYVGSNSTSLVFAKSTTFSAVTKGRIVNANVDLPAPFAANIPWTFQVQVRDSAFATAAAAEAGASYFGYSPFFTTVGNLGPAFNSIVNPNAPALSTWAAGTLDLSTESGLSGARGALSVQVIPEPASLALAGIGAAALLIFRRRK